MMEMEGFLEEGLSWMADRGKCISPCCEGRKKCVVWNSLLCHILNFMQRTTSLRGPTSPCRGPCNLVFCDSSRKGVVGQDRPMERRMVPRSRCRGSSEAAPETSLGSQQPGCVWSRHRWWKSFDSDPLTLGNGNGY